MVGPVMVNRQGTSRQKQNAVRPRPLSLSCSAP